METNWIGIIATSAVVAAAVAGVFTLGTQIYKSRQDRRGWLREQKYQVYARFVALIHEMSVLNPEIEFDELFRLQAQIELLFGNPKLLRQVHGALSDLTELYHNRPDPKQKTEYDTYLTQLEKASQTLTRLLRQDIG